MNEIFSDEIYRQMSEEYEKVLKNTSLASLALVEKKQPFKLKTGGELFEAVTIMRALKDAPDCYDIKSENYERIVEIYTKITGETPPEVTPAKYDEKTQIYLIQLLEKLFLKYQKTEHSPIILTIILSEITALGLLMSQSRVRE